VTLKKSDTAAPTTGAASAKPSGADVGMRIVAEMLAGMLLYGGLGWLGDRYWGTSVLLPLGLLIGFGLSIYLVVKRFGGR